MDQNSASGLYDENDPYNEHIPCVVVVVVVCSGLCRFLKSFSHITTVSGCNRKLSAHFYCVTSLKCHATDT